MNKMRRVNGKVAAISILTLIILAAMLYTNKIPQETFTGLTGIILGYYFGEYRGIYARRDE
jgi:hypothetical protein